MTGLKYYCIDIETNGLSSKGYFNEVWDFSIIRYDDRFQLTRRIKVEYPERSNPKSLEITGKTKNDLKYGDPKEKVVQEIIDFVNQDGLTPEHRVAITHNTGFDKRFIHAMFKACNQIFPLTCWLCTLALSRQEVKRLGLVKYGEEKPKLGLEDAMAHFNLTPFDGQAHTALQDSRNLYKLTKYFFDNNVDYLPLIKRVPHTLVESDTELKEDDI